MNQFKENTSKELEDTLKKLGENEIKGLVLDLRRIQAGYCTRESRLPDIS